MRIASGDATKLIYFVALDATDPTRSTFLTGLSAFTVYRSRNGSAAAAYTTPTVTEVSAANMPGVYKFLVDEDVTIDVGHDEQEMIFRITATGMIAVTRTLELYRPKITVGETLTVAGGVAGSSGGGGVMTHIHTNDAQGAEASKKLKLKLTSPSS